MSWPMGVVSDIAEVISGFAFKSEWFGAGDAKVIRIGDLKNGSIDLAGAEIFDDGVNKIREQFRIKRGDILMALSGATVGKIAVADAEAEGAYLNQRVAVVRGKCQENAEYLKYVFSGSLLQKLLLNAGGAAQPNLSPKDLAGMEIPLPPLPEQKRIAAILDKADAIRRKRQQAIQLVDDFLRAVFLDMFGDPVSNPKGWPKKSLKLLGKSATGRTPPGEKVGMWGEGLPFVTPGDLCGKVDSSVREVTREGAEYSKICRKGSLLVCCIGTVGKVGIAGRSLAFNQQINAQEWGSEISDIYGFFVFKLSPGLVSSKAIQTTLPILKKSLFDEIEIPVPPIGLQEKFSAIAQKVSESSLRHESGLNTSLFESLSQLAFSGQL